MRGIPLFPRQGVDAIVERGAIDAEQAGRLVLRAILRQHPDIRVAAINDLTDAKTLAYLFKYDSVHGVYEGEVSHSENSITVDGKEIRIFSEKDPEALPPQRTRILLLPAFFR